MNKEDFGKIIEEVNSVVFIIVKFVLIVFGLSMVANSAAIGNIFFTSVVFVWVAVLSYKCITGE